MQGNKLYIKVAEITDKLTVGNPTVGIHRYDDQRWWVLWTLEG